VRASPTTPHRPFPRAILVLGAIWAFAPVALVFVIQCLRFPGETFGLGFQVFALFQLWALAGLVLLVGSLIVQRRGTHRFAWMAVPAFLVGGLAVAALVASALAPLSRRMREARAHRLIESHGGAGPVHVDGDYGYDDEGWLVQEHVTVAPDGPTFHIDLTEAPWAGNRTYPVKERAPSALQGVPCDFGVAVPMGEGWWYVWLND